MRINTHSICSFVLIVSFLLCGRSQSFAQKQFNHEYEWKLMEDSLVSIVKKSLETKLGEGDNITMDSLAVKVVVKMLVSDKNLNYDFNSQNTFIKALYNPEKTFRIITWFFLQSPGYIIYRGVVQFKGGKLVPLFDQVRFMKVLDNGKQTDDMSSPNAWYGAYYYDMIPYTRFSKDAPKNKYVLLGRRQDHVLYDVKVMDVLTIENQSVSFGDYFMIPKSIVYLPSNKRFVILHKKNVGTVLKYDPQYNLVIFDMLDTEKDEEKKKINNKMFLIPTGLYHAFEYKKNAGWSFKEQGFEQLTPGEYLKKYSTPKPDKTLPQQLKPEQKIPK